MCICMYMMVSAVFGRVGMAACGKTEEKLAPHQIPQVLSALLAGFHSHYINLQILVIGFLNKNITRCFFSNIFKYKWLV